MLEKIEEFFNNLYCVVIFKDNSKIYLHLLNEDFSHDKLTYINDKVKKYNHYFEQTDIRIAVLREIEA